MNVTREVIFDLLPVYFAGDASADTRALVEDFFATIRSSAAWPRGSGRPWIDCRPKVGIPKRRANAARSIARGRA